MMQGCLMLTAQEPLPAPSSEPEIMCRICKFSARKQKLLTQPIEAIGKPLTEWRIK
ncbi:hypothetical protein P805_00302 [Serratia marcescens BIDMC 44]|nr:hypothetical protein P805_00302 [Serratia marcescens BIDMC 44]BEN49882.1 hypothetical protein SMKC057_19940 [Serratia marcescens]